ncbi:uncharacterized protein LOC109541476 [Dendroctonus ponderosae]|uniref:DUF3719 domain-containing protein n=1 Tax=Dendroctonus ponderosae TaxID=77166 RepID=U4UPF6_DENPD|nr:uncharacterized protein LOC109541476 [Dendroctonus ponderosae]ERL91900.1 hypothetical protein D910_09223 [Dendroctonus ponderosae]KAH1027306.1 hypothetical protein HUJ05_000838 [Dendroctonus ponderosae]KAH1027307.1 hypothetical protein HUJ05_000838 [Dendroctonus ponderosae]
MTGKLKSRSITSYHKSFSAAEGIDFSNFQQSALDSCLGEELKDGLGTAISTFSTSASELDDLGLRLSGLSSGSSLSWSEEYESEVTRKVQLELEKIDMIFKGVENESAMYDMKEIAEWKRFFPNIYILGCKTPTNSPDQSDTSLPEEDRIENCIQTQSIFPKNRRFVNTNQRHENISNGVLNPVRYCNSLPRKLKSLEIEHYLKISSIPSSDSKQRTRTRDPRQDSKELVGDVSPECTSLPFIATTPLKAQCGRQIDRNKPSKLLILPPINAAFRSISATPRKAPSKSIYGRLNSINELRAARLKSDLMTLFDNIPSSNR